MARFNQRESRDRKPAEKPAEITKKIKKVKVVEPIQSAAVKTVVTMKAKTGAPKMDKSKLMRKFFTEYRRKEVEFINNKRISKKDKGKFLKKSALLRRKKLIEYMKDPDQPINLSEIGAALDTITPVPVKKDTGKVTNKTFVKNQTADLDKMQKIAQHPVFQSNPMETLKTHLKNTLVRK